MRAELTEFEKLIARTWSALAARGESPTAEAIADRVGLDATLVARRLVEMRTRGELP